MTLATVGELLSARPAAVIGATEDQTGAVADEIMRLSRLAHDMGGRLLELDVSPLLVRPRGQGCGVVDARALFVE